MTDNWLVLAVRELKRPVTGDIFGTAVTIRLYAILIVLLAATGLFVARYELYQGKWRVLESRQYGYSIAYPANWVAFTYGDKGHRGSDYLRASFGHFLASGTVDIYEQRMAEPSLMQAAIWSEEILERQGAYNLSGLEEVAIGYGDYPALSRTFITNDMLGRHLLYNVFYIATDERIFMLEFSAYQRKYEKSAVIFNTMLDSFRLSDTVQNKHIYFSDVPSEE